ncbi:MAG: hypothetical protein FWD34_10425 [Oscillospiraceae bacterium]|nr:hypothetical protein [Oscillospiraceae bacterium]
MKDFQVILENAAFAGCLVEVLTKDRGLVKGEFVGVDEFDTDDERFGFFIDTIDGWADSVYLDEIIDIVVLPKADELKRAAV